MAGRCLGSARMRRTVSRRSAGRISATSIANYEENKQLKASNEALQSQVTQLTARVRELDRNIMLRWLLAGGALVLLGLILGAWIKSRPKRSSWA